MFETGECHPAESGTEECRALLSRINIELETYFELSSAARSKSLTTLQGLFLQPSKKLCFNVGGDNELKEHR